jgi:endonuclease IV
LLADKRSRGVPLILETPEKNLGIAADDDSADPYDAQMIALVRNMVGSG